jgi:acyl-CoA dehydrogenase
MVIYKSLFSRVKSIIPKISETELIALRSGGVSIDRDIFSGKINKAFFDVLPNSLTKTETDYLYNTVDDVLSTIGKNKLYPSKEITKNMRIVGDAGLLGMIIDTKYGGSKLSITAQSKILSKLSSYNPSLGVVVMVPNSLGPGELLQHYGTETQKNEYLPRLAKGEYIPCFGLTGPNNGSDATGQIDKGAVEYVDGKKKIKITLNKRYITLAPIANLLGIAFDLEDPNGKSGVTVALIKNTHFGLHIKTHHNPNNAGFPNGTIKGTIHIDYADIIGGPEKAGEGWKMLMECLAVGRGVSLPATSNGASKMITFGISNYIKHRKQFKLPIGEMEAVKEKYIEMFYNTWVINASVSLTNHILDQKKTPSVLTAIMKQQTTERGRIVLNNAMDIYAGSAICVGENNFLTDFYNSSPVGITVEGSNTLTRGLIIFGQGLNKSHPHIYNIFDSIQNNDVTAFRTHFNKMIKDVAVNYCKSALSLPTQCLDKRVENLVVKFSNLTNFVSLLGGKIKANQMLSGDMADILSNLYLIHSVIWYHKHCAEKNLTAIETFCIERLLNEAEGKVNKVVDNYPNTLFKYMLHPTKIRLSTGNKYSDVNKMYHFIKNTEAVNNIIKQDLFYKNTVFEKLEKLNTLSPETKEYMDLYNEVIQVGEFEIRNSS